MRRCKAINERQLNYMRLSFEYSLWFRSYQWLINLWLFLPIFFNPLIPLGFSHSYYLPHRSLLVKLTDSRFTCLMIPVKNKRFLTSPVKMKFRDDSHHYFLCFLYIVNIRFTPSTHLLLFSHLL